MHANTLERHVTYHLLVKKRDSVFNLGLNVLSVIHTERDAP